MLPLLIPIGLSAAAGVLCGKKIAKITARRRAEGKSSIVKTFDRAISVDIKREYILSDETLVLASEDIPLDNRCGSNVLTSEHEFSRTAVVNMEIDKSRDVGTSFRSGLWKAFEARVSGELSRSMGVKIGSQMTRRVRLRFSVAPEKMVSYRIVWKQESRRGEFEVLVDGKRTYKIPYMVTYGLSHSVESTSDGTFTDSYTPPPPHCTDLDVEEC